MLNNELFESFGADFKKLKNTKQYKKIQQKKG